MSAAASPSPIRRLSILLFILFGLAYALFTQDNASHNTLCRAAMTANMVEYGRDDINGYENMTRDKAFRDGKFYCDKAPGMTFMALPMAAVFTQVFPVTPETVYGRTWFLFLYLSALTTSALLCAAAGVLLFQYIWRRTQNIHAALIGAIAFGLGSSVWGWATSFFSHSAAAALLVMGFIALDTASRRQAAGGRHGVFALLAGLAFGAATAVEYPTLIATMIIGAAFALIAAWKRPVDVIVMFAVVAIGALIPLIPVFIFHASAFGSAFTTGYAFTVDYSAHRTGLFGINAPKPDVIGKLLISPERGVIWYAPVVLAMAWAAVRLSLRNGWRAVGVITGLVAIWYLLMNAGFEYWEGGASTGPRYLTPALGFSALALGLAWPLFGTWERRGALALLAVSILINFAATAVDMTGEGKTIARAFFSGDLRHTLTYRLIEHASPLHFAAPILGAAALGWLIWKETKRLRIANETAL